MSAPTRRSLLHISGSLLASGLLAGCIGELRGANDTTITQTNTEEPTSVSLKTSNDYSGPHPIGDLNPKKYYTIKTTQNAVSFALPSVELPKGYRFVRATIAASNPTTNQNRTTQTKEYVALIYANHSNDSETDWAVVYIVHPQVKAQFRIGQNVSIGDRTGAYYGNRKDGHLHFICNDSEYELSGPFSKDKLVQIAQSICTAEKLSK